MAEIHRQSGRTYGVPHVTAELKKRRKAGRSQTLRLRQIPATPTIRLLLPGHGG
ncbi:hypothetical protein ACFYY1_42790 [Streptomyces sp. NPDC001890]|uniref:hypothetical protein n=1 Tax=Streptomyces sp. NPDC001890 TaxID=3364620 RepID=UPI0036BFF404